MFKEILNFIVKNVNGVDMLAIFDIDGILVSKLERKKRTAEEIVAEFSSVLKYVNQVTDFLATGKMKKMFVECDTESFYLHKINNNYYLVAVMNNEAILGKLKYVISLVEGKLKKELDV
jgi:predicted regulator of Ras-like GTPase activity (Roadblock/LC7/MglB family)